MVGVLNVNQYDTTASALALFVHRCDFRVTKSVQVACDLGRLQPLKSSRQCGWSALNQRGVRTGVKYRQDMAPVYQS